MLDLSESHPNSAHDHHFGSLISLDLMKEMTVRANGSDLLAGPPSWAQDLAAEPWDKQFITCLTL